MVSVLSQTVPVYNFPSYFLKFHFNIIPFLHLGDLFPSGFPYFPRVLVFSMCLPFGIFTYQVPNTTSIFRSLHRSKVSVKPEAMYNIKYHSDFLRRGLVKILTKPQAVGPPTVGYPPLLIQYICNYRPYLEAISFIRNLKWRHAA
jgi:hypothetical protein